MKISFNPIQYYPKTVTNKKAADFKSATQNCSLPNFKNEKNNIPYQAYYMPIFKGNIEQKGTKEVTKDELRALLKENGFVKLKEQGPLKSRWKYMGTEKFLNDSIKKYGKGINKQMHQVYELSLEEYKEAPLLSLMNANSGKHADFWKENFPLLLYTYNRLYYTKSNLTTGQKVSPEIWETVLHPILDLNNMPSEEIVKIIEEHKSGCDLNDMVERRSKQDTEETVPEKLNKYINTLTEYIDTQDTPEDIVVYRAENPFVLTGIKLQDGSDLGQLLTFSTLDFDLKHIMDIDKKLKDFKYTFHNPRFTLTSLYKNVITSGVFASRDLRWIIKVPKGTKGVFAETINCSQHYNSESEFIIQRGADIKIQKICYNYKTNKWNIIGEIEGINYEKDDVNAVS